jgi:hypothetical protein
VAIQGEEAKKRLLRVIHFRAAMRLDFFLRDWALFRYRAGFGAQAARRLGLVLRAEQHSKRRRPVVEAFLDPTNVIAHFVRSNYFGDCHAVGFSSRLISRMLSPAIYRPTIRADCGGGTTVRHSSPSRIRVKLCHYKRKMPARLGAGAALPYPYRLFAGGGGNLARRGFGFAA